MRIQKGYQYYCSHSLLLMCNADSESGESTGQVGDGAGLGNVDRAGGDGLLSSQDSNLSSDEEQYSHSASGDSKTFTSFCKELHQGSLEAS